MSSSVGISSGARQARRMILDANAFTHYTPIVPDLLPRGRLHGLGIAIKANLATQTLPTTCASLTLQGRSWSLTQSDYTSPFNATVVQRLLDQGAYVVGKTNMDEFGMGSSNIHSVHGPVRNPRYTDHPRIAGGSSGGSAAAVALGTCFAALGSDTGGSVRLPAAYCGVVGFKPSYGLLSRYGLVAYASSLDTVGILAKKVDHVRRVFDVARARDPKDSTSWEHAQPVSPISKISKLRIGVPQEYFFDGLSQPVLEAWSDALTALETQGAEIVPVSLPHTKYALPAYYVIAPAEASSNLARYDGIRYGIGSIRSLIKTGYRSGDGFDYLQNRTQGFGKEVKKRILLGTYVLQAKYDLSMNLIQQLVKQDFESVLIQDLAKEGSETHVHALLTPVSTESVPPRLDQPLSSRDADYINDVMTIPASLAGLPAIVLPFGKNQIGLQIIGAFGHDDWVLNIAEGLESLNH